MIPLTAIPWRAIGYGVLALAVLTLGWRVHAWREAYKALPEAQAALQREIECGEGSECLKRSLAAQAQAEAASAVILRGYEDELEALRNRPAVRRVIRVCPDPGADHLLGSGTAGPADGTGAAPGVVHGAIEFDPRPLFDLARDADELAARLRALQEWNRALAGE